MDRFLFTKAHKLVRTGKTIGLSIKAPGVQGWRMALAAMPTFIDFENSFD